MLELKDVTVTFHEGTINERKALQSVSFVLQEDDFICILGGNGAGKSTLLNAVSGFVEIDSGSIILDEKDITNLPEYRRAKHVGRLFQDPMKGTAASMSVLENLGLAYSRGKKSSSFLQKAVSKEDTAYFKERLSSLGLGLENRLHTKVGLLSGGQRQALTLLMATLVPPKVLLLDEHTAALDPKTAERIMEVTDQIIHQDHLPTIMITHNIRQALSYGNKLAVMHEGRIVKIMEKEEKSRMTAESLLSMYDLLS